MNDYMARVLIQLQKHYPHESEYLQAVQLWMELISPAAEDLVKKGMAMPEGELLYVTAIGAITNVASALLNCTR